MHILAQRGIFERKENSLARHERNRESGTTEGIRPTRRARAWNVQPDAVI